jgi:hypothetical protein
MFPAIIVNKSSERLPKSRIFNSFQWRRKLLKLMRWISKIMSGCTFSA